MFEELGSGYKDTIEPSPVPVVGLTNVSSVALAYHVTVALRSDGTVYGWGGNALGQVGNGTHQEIGVPTNLGLHGVKQVTASGAHAAALLENGTIVNWGSNEFGELGNGHLNPIHHLNRFGRWEYTMQGSGSASPVAVPGVSNVVRMAEGLGTFAALLSNGTVLMWGKNDSGQLGHGTLGPQICKTEIGLEPCDVTPGLVVTANHEPLRGVTAIAGQGGATYALLSNGKVMAWGIGGHGQMGNGSTSNSDVAIEVPGLSGVVAISGGGPFGLALLSNGHVEGWGGNEEGQLGPPSGETCQAEPCVRRPRLLPGLEHVSKISGGRGFLLALSNGQLYSQGANAQWGQLGIGTFAPSDKPKLIPGLSGVTNMYAGEQHAVAVLGGPAPAPQYSVTPQSGSLVMEWSVTAPVYALRWRTWNHVPQLQGPWSPMTTIRKPASPASPDSYSIPGLLPGVQYAVELLSYPAPGAKPFVRIAIAKP